MRAAFEDAAATLLTTIDRMRIAPVGSAGPRRLDRSRADRAHAARLHDDRALPVCRTHVDRLIVDAAEFFRVAPRGSERARSVSPNVAAIAGARLTDPVGESEATAQRVLALVASTADDDVVNTTFGR